MAEQERRPEESEEKLSREKIVTLGNELCEEGETFPFSGIELSAYEIMKKADEEYPGFTTLVDEIVERLTKEGMKIVPQKHQNGQFFILPAQSDNIEMDSISPEQLIIAESMPENLKKLILAFKRQ